MKTSATVRIPPTNPAIMKGPISARAGSASPSQGMMYCDVTSAIMPPIKPTRNIKTNVFSLLAIYFTY